MKDVENQNAEAKENVVTLPHLSKHSLLGRWTSEVVTPFSLSVNQVMGTEETVQEISLAQIIGEPAPNYYLVEVYWYDLTEWSPKYQELKRIEELQGKRFYNSMAEALAPFSKATEINEVKVDYACHCGRPVYFHPVDLNTTNVQPFTRGLCKECDANRCDADPTDCPYAGEKETPWLSERVGITVENYRELFLDTVYGRVNLTVDAYIHGLTKNPTVRFTYDFRHLPQNVEVIQNGSQYDRFKK